MPPFDNVISNMEWSLKEARTELEQYRSHLATQLTGVEASQGKIQQTYERVQELEQALAVLKNASNGAGG